MAEPTVVHTGPRWKCSGEGCPYVYVEGIGDEVKPKADMVCPRGECRSWLVYSPGEPKPPPPKPMEQVCPDCFRAYTPAGPWRIESKGATGHTNVSGVDVEMDADWLEVTDGSTVIWSGDDEPQAELMCRALNAHRENGLDHLLNASRYAEDLKELRAAVQNVKFLEALDFAILELTKGDKS